MAKDRLRDWDTPSYNAEGRYNTLEEKGEKSGNEMSKHGNGMREGDGEKSSADEGRHK